MLEYFVDFVIPEYKCSALAATPACMRISKDLVFHVISQDAMLSWCFAIYNKLGITMDESKNKFSPRWMIVGIVITGIASIGTLVSTITKAIDKVRAGQGTDTYKTFWQVEFNHIGLLVLFCAIFAALVIGGILRYREYREWLELEKKYGANIDNT